MSSLEYVDQPARRLAVGGVCDVTVVGGGIAGVAAALAAARLGASVRLIESSCGLGGLATRGNVAVCLPLRDGCGHQVIAGMHGRSLA